MRKIKVNEYDIIEDLKNGTFKALRHGEEWQNLVGDNFVLSLVDLIDDLTKENMVLQQDSQFLDCLFACGVDNWNGYSDAKQMMYDDEE